jgi:serine protease Do
VSLKSRIIASILTLVFVAHLPGTAKEAALGDLMSVQSRVMENHTRALQALVAIECNGGTASGVIISPEGLVLTAAHVVNQAKRKTKITLHNGKTVEGTSLGLDTATDAAMVQLPAPAKAWPYVSISREVLDLKTGQWCFALGNPGGWDPARGPVLRVGRIVKIAPNMLQSDCVLMGGDSGGALFNLNGEVIGVHSQIWKGRDQNLHVSMAPFLRSWDALKKGEVITEWQQGSGGWIGLSTSASTAGVCVQAIAPDSPAQNAGLKEGDIILSVNNRKLTVPADFSETIRYRRAGELVTLKVKSAEVERVLEVKLAKRPEE